MQYDTPLRLEGISGDLQMSLGVAPSETVMFERLQVGRYRDGIKFANGKKISLQLLGSGVGVTLVPTKAEPKVNKVDQDREKALELMVSDFL